MTIKLCINSLTKQFRRITEKLFWRQIEDDTSSLKENKQLPNPFQSAPTLNFFISRLRPQDLSKQTGKQANPSTFPLIPNNLRFTLFVSRRKDEKTNRHKYLKYPSRFSMIPQTATAARRRMPTKEENRERQRLHHRENMQRKKMKESCSSCHYERRHDQWEGLLPPRAKRGEHTHAEPVSLSL